MAEAIVSKVAKLLEDLTEEGKLWDVVEFRMLKKTVSTLQNIVPDAEKRNLKSWLHDLKAAFYDAEDFLEEWRFDVMQLRKTPSKDEKLKQVDTLFPPSNELASELKSIRKRLEVIAARGKSLHLREHAKDVQVDKRSRKRR